MKVLEVQRTWMTIKDAAAYLGVSRDFVRDIISDGELHTYRLRHTIFLRKEEIDALLQGNRII